MKKEIVVFECDNCHAPGSPEVQTDPLPKGWTEITMVDDQNRSTKLQICTLCHIAVGNALGVRQNESRTE